MNPSFEESETTAVHGDPCKAEATMFILNMIKEKEDAKEALR
jgi:hypothetical protein